MSAVEDLCQVTLFSGSWSELCCLQTASPHPGCSEDTMCCGYSSRAWCQFSPGQHYLAPGMFTFFQLLQKERVSNHSLTQQSRTIVFKTFCKYHNNPEQKYLKAAIVQYIYFPRRFVWKYCVSAAVSQTTHDLVGVKY